MDNDAETVPCALTIEVAGKYPVQLGETELTFPVEYPIDKTSDALVKLLILVVNCVEFKEIPWYVATEPAPENEIA